MNQSLLGLALQDSAANDQQMWIILAVVLVILFFIVVIVAVGLVIFFIMRKRKKALSASAPIDASLPAGPSASAYAGMSQPEPYAPASQPEPYGASSQPDPYAASSQPDPYAASSQPDPYAPASQPDPYATYQPETSYAGTSQPESAYASMSSPETAETLDPDLHPPIGGTSGGVTEPFDPSRTVAIIRESTVAISYGTIKFVSGVLTGQQFAVEPEGAFIGRDNNLSQIVVADPRISKRHLWIGVQDGSVKIVDQDSRNGTFINDPKSDRVTEAVINPGDTVIMGESDVARFEYEM
jgi:hypothetical protein